MNIELEILTALKEIKDSFPAAIAYNIGALKYFGEFAKLNNIMCQKYEN